MSRFTLFGLPMAVLLLFAAIFGTSLVLPSANTGIFASPDETAVAVSIERIAQTGSASVPEVLAKPLPWLHPRSYVASGDALLPVGFLGWPWVLAQLHHVLPLTPLAWFASLLAVSGSIPWYLLLRKRFGERAAWWGTALAWTFPPVLLYANRSLFSHLPQYSAALWAVWLLVKTLDPKTATRKARILQLIAGALLGLAASFRPVEAIWLIPLFVLIRASFGSIMWRKQLLVFVGCLFGLLPLFLTQAHTYGSWFQIGYWVSANTDPAALIIPQTAGVLARPWFYAFAPYGLHPRNILWNVQSFFLWFLGPWIALTLIGGVCTAFLQRRVPATISLRRRALQLWGDVRSHWIGCLVVGFVGGWLLLIYGSGLYTDHVRFGAVTVANSFLRYTIPFGFAFAWFVAWMFLRWSSSVRAMQVLSVLSLLLVVGGVYTAFARDEESIFATRRELIRYTAIRSEALKTFTAGDVILSDRSDKIFFPILRAATPLPSAEQVQAFTLNTSSTALGLFSRPLSPSERDAWRKMGYDVRELQTFDRERLYRLQPFLR